MAREIPEDNAHSRAELEEDCKRIARTIEGELVPGVGFALFLFSFGERGNLAYLSNAQREDMIATIGEWLLLQLGPEPPDRATAPYTGPRP